MPNEERIEKLCQALESGEYKQCQGTLRKRNKDFSLGYCCLGIATKLYEDEMGKDKDLWKEEVMRPTVSTWYGFLLPNGRTDPNPQISVPEGMVLAAELNDNGMDFKEIAKAFRRTYLEGE